MENARVKNWKICKFLPSSNGENLWSSHVKISSKIFLDVFLTSSVYSTIDYNFERERERESKSHPNFLCYKNV